LYILNKDTR